MSEERSHLDEIGHLPAEAVITIDDLPVRCVIGTHRNERLQPQLINLTLSLWADVMPAILSDDLNMALDYERLCHRLVSLIEGSTYHLLESLAYAVAKSCLEDNRVSRVKVKLAKPEALPAARAVCIELSLRR